MLIEWDEKNLYAWEDEGANEDPILLDFLEFFLELQLHSDDGDFCFLFDDLVQGSHRFLKFKLN